MYYKATLHMRKKLVMHKNSQPIHENMSRKE